MNLNNLKQALAQLQAVQMQFDIFMNGFILGYPKEEINKTVGATMQQINGLIRNISAEVDKLDTDEAA